MKTETKKGRNGNGGNVNATAGKQATRTPSALSRYLMAGVEEQLHNLAERLSAIEAKLVEGKSSRTQRECAAEALDAVHDFLKGMPLFSPNRLTVIKLLSVALDDVATGRQPKLFSVTKEEQKDPGKPGKRFTTYEEFLRVKTACCVQVLRNSGEKAGKAREHVRSRWKVLGIRQVVGREARDIKTSTIKDWELWVRSAPRGSIEHKMMRSASASVRSLQQARSYVEKAGRELAAGATWEDKVAPKK